MLEVGPATLRMIFFVTCLYAGFVFAIKHPSKCDGLHLAFSLVFLYLFVHVIPLLVGSIKGYDFGVMFRELQQSLYWLAAPFIALVLRSRDMVLRAATLVCVAGRILAVTYLSAIAALELGAIDFLTLYTIFDETGEFAFRNESLFFYKGFLYLGISAVFFFAIQRRFSIAWAMIITIALMLTLTRGFILSTSFAILLLLISQRRLKYLIVGALLVACILFVVFMYIPSQDNVIENTRELSNSQRIDDFYYIVTNIKPSTFFIGEGFGSLINDRINIENTFLWVLWKIGIIGVLFWLLPLAFCLVYFYRIKRCNPDFNLACAFMFSTLLIYTQTLSNPYLNNPIGLSFVIVAIFSLRTLSKVTPSTIKVSYVRSTPSPAKENSPS